MIGFALCVWVLVGGITSGIYTLSDGRLVDEGWDGTLSALEMLLIIVCLPIIAAWFATQLLIEGLVYVVNKTWVGKVLTCKFKIGR